MKFIRFWMRLLVVFLMATLPAGCGHKESGAQHGETKGHDHDNESHDHDSEDSSEAGEVGHEEDHDEDHDEDHGEEGYEEDHEEGHDEPASGASFKAGKGVILTEETGKILGVETAEAASEKLARSVRFNVQVFGETHPFPHLEIDHTGCDVHGSGYLPEEKAGLVRPQQPLKLLTADKDVLEGVVVAVQKTLALGETEIVVGVTSAADKLADGEFLTAIVSVPRDEEVIVIPASALLRTSEGTFVYVAAQNAYRRTAVKSGSESDGKIEIAEGLSAGDRVVTSPVQTLWLIELRATKGGGHSH